MKALRRGKALLLAVATALVVLSTDGTTLQSMSQNWFRRKLQGPTPLSDLSAVNSLSELITRLNVAGFKGRRTEADFILVFESLRTCFRSFSPPPGLALDFTQHAEMSPDDLIRNFFKFLPPWQFIQGPTENRLSQASFVEMAPDGAAPESTEPTPPVEDQPEESRPLRTIRFANSPKHILAHIIKNIYSHFRGPTCQQTAKRLDGAARFLLRNNSKAALMEPLLVYSLIQGNAASAAKLQILQNFLRDVSEDNSQLQQTPHIAKNNSPKPGIYDPIMLVFYFDLAKAGYTSKIKALERHLGKPADERIVGSKLFGNSLANPLTHQKVTEVGRAVGGDEELLKKVVEHVGLAAMDSSDAVSILMPDAPKVAAFLRGVSFFVFENVFKQNGPYVMPGLPCGGNLTGNMLETLTGKKLGKKYFVYKYTRALQGISILPESVWTPDSDSQLARLLKENQQANGDYLFSHLPRVCVRSVLFTKCSKKPPSDTKTNEQLLCHFINTHQSLFFEVDGAGVNALRKSMQEGQFSGGRVPRKRSALSRSVQAIGRFFFNKTSAALVLGAGVGGLCIATGEFDRELDTLSVMLGEHTIQHRGTGSVEETAAPV
ncbi:uncharacterized protein EMH_0090790 [Eimeria mitis]|uniref:Uncharacterized protein n=1 Tax=Eimeria mitis TaxID=44415 RepID=U6KC07_9EIME|nr:uncharacterized protein EMH_0090790 [Eimeria mitis]CDJ33777.1 hypothetical protein, conserved [Eimeria mitis]